MVARIWRGDPEDDRFLLARDLTVRRYDVV